MPVGWQAKHIVHTALSSFSVAQSALEASIAKHFPGNHAINCMCHSTENLYRWVGYLCNWRWGEYDWQQSCALRAGGLHGGYTLRLCKAVRMAPGPAPPRRMSATAVARASDDFYPRDPASSTPHIAACAYNSLFIGALLTPDWDMFHSKHSAARLHATAR